MELDPKTWNMYRNELARPPHKPELAGWSTVDALLNYVTEVTDDWLGSEVRRSNLGQPVTVGGNPGAGD